MDEFYHIINAWYVKLAFGILSTILSPFKVSFAILCLMIIIDTISGSIYAVRVKKFSSRGMRKALKKIFVYFICILVVRLMEIGIASIIETDMLTVIMIGFLIVTETGSVLENLTLLGVPLPAKLTHFIINQIKSPAVKDLISAGVNKKEYVGEIMEMIDFHFPNIKDENIKKMLDIKFKEWAQFVNLIDFQLSNPSDSNEILYYRVSALIDTTMNRIQEAWKEENISEECIREFNVWHGPRLGKWREEVKAICFTNVDVERKKIQIIEKVIVRLYQTLTDMQKLEWFKDGQSKE